MPAPAPTVCNACARMVPTKASPAFQPFRVQHESNIGAFKASAEYCILCRFVLYCLKTSPRPWAGHAQWIESFDGLDIDRDAVITVDVEKQLLQDELASVECSVRAKSENETHCAKFVITVCGTTSPILTRAIWSESCESTKTRRLNLVHSWLNGCRSGGKDHLFCKPTDGRLPKRLLKIDAYPLRLVSTEHLDAASIEYTTLSHCWGKTGCIKSTMDTISKFESHIAFEALPKSFQDAVEITRAVKIPYVWIDSLCILQGDTAEWEIESAKMADIFQGSSLTIAATDAADAHGGCNLDPCAAGDWTPFTGLCGEDSARFEFFDAERGVNLQVRVQVANILIRVNQSALNSRGWVLQEVVLSGRLLHCTRQEMYWKCRAKCESEMGMTYEPFSRNHKLPRLRSDHLDEAIGTWYQWIRNYTPRSFSVAQDRIAALAGITKYYQSMTNDKPLVGLWRSTISKDLEWRSVVPASVVGNQEIAIGDDRVLAGVPTWSWLSCRTCIDFGFEGGFEDDCAFTSWHVRYDSDNIQWASEALTSPLIVAQLVLRGPLSTLSFCKVDRSCASGPNILHVLDAARHGSVQSSSVRCKLQFDHAPSLLQPVECLLLRTVTQGDRCYEIFLMLLPSGTSVVAQEFLRIGIGSLTALNGFSGCFDHYASQRVLLV